MQMPDLTGYEVALRLRQPGGRHEKTFLILVSAYSDLDEVTASGVSDARIDKPASRRELMTALARVTPVTPVTPTMHETPAMPATPDMPETTAPTATTATPILPTDP